MTARLPDGRIPVLLSAHEQHLVAQDAAAILDYLDREPSADELTDVAATLLHRRRVRRHRALIRAADIAELSAGLRALASDEDHPLVTRSSASAAVQTAFVFPGQGNQWPSMGSAAYHQLALYREEAHCCAEVFIAAGLPSPLSYLVNAPVERDWSQVEIQGAQFTHSVCLARIWRSYGVFPGITVGHSLGEAAAAHVAGAVTLPAAVAVVGARATVIDQLPGRYGMAVLGAGVDEAQRLIAETPGWLEISAVNAPSSTVISGDRGAVDVVVQRAKERGVFARPITVEYPGHTSALDPLRPMFEQLLPASEFHESPVEFVSSALGTVVGPGTDFADYWWRNLRTPVRFDRAVAVAIERGANAFAELSAHPSLLSALAELVDDDSTVLVDSGTRHELGTDRISANIAAAALADPGYRWIQFAGVRDRPPLWGFPNAPMGTVHFWAARDSLPAVPGTSVTVAYEHWEPADSAHPTKQAGHRIAVIAPDASTGPLARLLADAIVAQSDCELTTTDEADITVIVAPAFDQPGVSAASRALIDAGPPDYRHLIGPHCRTVWLVTAQGETVAADDPPVLPAQSALTALHRSTGFEFPDKSFGHLDLPRRDIATDHGRVCVDVLTGDVDNVALREDANGTLRPYVRRLSETNDPVPHQALDRPTLDNVLITGGSGAIGQAYALRCIECGARRVTLLSRGGLRQHDLDRLRDGRYVELRAPACDITDPESVRRTAAEYAGDGASLLIHAAGTAHFGPHDRLTRADWEDMFGAKVAGLELLATKWPLREDARLLLCSSVSGLWGGYGHGGYAASNRMLDALATRLRADGLNAISMRWGLWRDTTLADHDEIVRIERSGLVAMDPDAAVMASFCQHDSDPVIIAADFDRLGLFFESQGLPSPFAAAPTTSQPQPTGDGTVGRSVDQVVRAEIAELLGVSVAASVDLTAPLLDLGLDSLLAVDLRKRLSRVIGRTIPLSQLLGGMTGAEVIDMVRSDRPSEGAEPERRSHVADTEAIQGVPAAPSAPPSAPAVGATPGMSATQRRIWSLQSVDPDSAQLNVCASYQVTGAVDCARLHRAVDTVATWHPPLRSTYRRDDDGKQHLVVHSELRPAWAEYDLSDLEEQPQRLRLEVLAQREFGRPFDLTADSPLRITAAHLGTDKLALLVIAHPIAWDDGSWPVFFRDLTRAYGDPDAAASLEPPPTIIDGSIPVDSDLDHWRTLVSDLPEPLDLPGANGSVVPHSWHARRITRRLPAPTVQGATAFAYENETSPHTVLLAAFAALVHRYTHATDFLIAAPISGRRAGTEDAVGNFGNLAMLRARPRAGQSFRELHSAIRASAAEAFSHPGVDLDWLAFESDPGACRGIEPTARVGFGFRQPDGHGFCPPGVECERSDLHGHFAQLPLTFMVEWPTAAGAGPLVEAEYLVEVLDQPLVQQLLDHYTVLLDSALAEPDTQIGRLTLMSAADSEWLRAASAGPEFSSPSTTLPALVTARAALAPDAVAVVYEGRQYSYRQVNEEANRLARWLIEQGLGTEDRVAVLLDKSPELVITALGILKAGAVYLPIDPTYPEDRLAFIVDDAAAALVLRQAVTGLQQYSGADLTDDELIRPLRPDNTAYLMYTSGSTGLPKGVPVPHAPIAEYFSWFGDAYQVDETDRLLQVASPGFDVSIAEIFGLLICGGRLVIPRPDGLRDVGYLTDLLRREGITSMHFVPSLLGLFLSLPGVNQWRTLRRVPVGGEALPGEIADKFHATFDALLYNFYGPTETVINATSYQVEGTQGARTVPIGRPKINTQMHLLDAFLQPVPAGVVGEIYIGGTQMARGYHRRPGLTAERFVADPFTPGGRLYRSGDLARRNADGDIEFVGRVDEQVKIRGVRIELGEVAAAISVDPSVGQAVVVALDLPQIGKSLVGYVTPADSDTGTVDVERIRARVAAALPVHMIPVGYVVLDEIPMTAHGKIDRDALPHPEVGSATQYREPTTATEHRLADLFATLLGHDRVGVDDSFFDLGGHSLVATRLVASIRSEFGVEIGIRDVFESATVARLAQWIEGSASGAVTSTRPRLCSTSHDGPLPLSASQLRTWFAYQIEGPSEVNNIPFGARLRGPCDVDALTAALNDVVARHEILRTTYTSIDGVPYQVIEPVGAVPVRRATGTGELWLQEQLDSERRYCFALDREWPIRAAVLSTTDRPDEHTLSLVVHHIAIDHWSGGVLFTDLLTAYRARRAGQPPSWAPLPVQYADYAAWQAALLAESGGDEPGIATTQRDYWKRQLAGLPEDTGLRPDYPRPPVPSGAGDSVEFEIDASTRGKLAAVSRDLGITEFMLLQAAVAVVLHKAGGGVDIPVGTPIAARDEPELDQLIGFFINILVLRNNLHGNPTLREVLARTRDTALAAYAHQDLPFDRVVDVAAPIRTLARNPLFQVVVHVRDHLPAAQVIDSDSGGDTVFSVVEPTFDIAHADLSVNFFAGDTGYRGNVLYRTELYRRATIERLVGWLTHVVDAFTRDVDQTLRDVSLINPPERNRILTEWSRGPKPPVERPLTIAELLEPSRAWGSDRIALRCGDDQIDYPALHRRSDNFARLLASRGVRPGSLVGLSTRRDIDMVVAMVAIMKAGAGLFPLDPGYPFARKQFMLDDADPRVVVVTAEALPTMPERPGMALISLDDPAVFDAPPTDGNGAESPLPAADPDDPMYLVFTSGSTGKPKGVLGTHRAMTTRLNWQLANYPVAGNDIRLAQASWTFLEGCMETLGGLAAGATTILADDAEHRDPEALASLVRRHSIAQVTAVPTLVSAIIGSWPDAFRSLTRLVCGAEPLPASLQEQLLAGYGDADGPELLNNFGATETSGALIRGPLTPPVPLLGTPMTDAQVYLLDDGLSPVPPGVIGELYYAGGQLVRGYWRRPGLTASRFVANPFTDDPGARLYRSGDRARWTQDGRLEFVGRTDHQVKIRGFRVELGEVDEALKSADGVATAAARAWQVGGSTTLAGYVVPRRPLADEAERSAFAAAVRADVARVLPGYMVPASVTVLDEMPKTESGKLNRPALPRPAVSTTGESEPPRTGTERALARVFVDLLPIAAVGRFDDFFALGGDSILSVQVAARARAAGLPVHPRMVFESPTVQQLAAAVDAAQANSAASDTQHAPMSTSGLSAEDLAAVTRSWSPADGRPA
ncbi:mycobactin polyketide synthase MbtD [[Mycobacterium] nativiensis]|uniref:Mycobactin polyketide synthase MbtD n=1 Tax=[Mycobacterium] nativiensis TaxID=2855503 RepID=A0ABU5XY29_9MYCO|nr:mycobactin polyketide synthase MbtD [Mycolicibacter sp. MYC340]MEB3032889.1 mycobactin polyketide synthase MbtD [Mycolicibacter sp. MYC340]